MPYMATFHPNYLTAYFVGMGLSALVPSLVSLLQGTLSYDCVRDATNTSTAVFNPVYYPPRFSVFTYNVAMCMWLCLSVAAFIALHWFSHLILPEAVSNNTSVVTVDKKTDYVGQKTATTSRTAPWGSHPKRFWFLLVCLALVCAQMNSVVPSIQSFSVMPYSLLTYHLALSLSNLAQPLACFMPFWLAPKSTKTVASLTGLSSVLCLWIVVLALQSPTPWLYYSFWGAFMAVCLAICSSFLNAYLRTMITSLLREEAAEGKKRV